MAFKTETTLYPTPVAVGWQTFVFFKESLRSFRAVSIKVSTVPQLALAALGTYSIFGRNFLVFNIYSIYPQNESLPQVSVLNRTFLYSQE